VAYANWGPTNLSILGSATFPAGSEIYYQTSTPSENAYAYDVTSPVTTFGTGAAAGGDARNNTTLPCFAAFNGQVTSFNVGTLEQLATVATGNACIVNPQSDANGSSTDPNRWWGASSVSLGTVDDAAVRPVGTQQFYTTSAALRVAFVGGNAVRYYSCLTRTSSGSIRNCTSVGSGTYAIQTLGTAPNIARVMTLTDLPPVAQRLNFTRIFVERAGTVYLGYRSNSNVTRSTLRLNLPAANAVLNAVGIAPITP
jgi:trimeric autotransporter adhesin